MNLIRLTFEPMKKILKILSFIGITFFLLLVIAVLALYHLAQQGEFRRFLITEFEKRTELKVQVGEAGLEMGRVLGVSFRDFALLTPESNRPVITAEKILIRVALLPLMERRMVFNEVRLHRPTLQLVREESGRIPHLELLMKLLYERTREVPLAFDLREIYMEKGELLFRDSRSREGAPLDTYFHALDLRLRRVTGGQAPRSGSPGALEAAAGTEKTAVVEATLATNMERWKRRTKVTAKGKIIFPDGEPHFRRAWLDAETYVQGMPVDLFWDYYGSFLPVKSARGDITVRLRWQGSLVERLRLTGEIDFKELAVKAQRYFAGELGPGDGRANLEVEVTPQGFHVSRFEMNSGGIFLTAQGSARSSGEWDPYVEARLMTPFLPFSTVRRYVPATLLDTPGWGSFIRAVNRGEVRFKEVRFAGQVSELGGLLEPGFERRLWMEAEVKGLGAKWPGDRHLPLRDVNGRLVLENGILYYKGLSGGYGLSRLTEVEGSQRGVVAGPDLLELRVRGEADLQELHRQLKLHFLRGPAAKAESLVQELEGRGKFRLSLRTDFQSLQHYEGQLSLEDARVRVADLPLSQVRGSLSFTPSELRTPGLTGFLSGSPVQIQLALKNYDTDKSAFDLTLNAPSGVRAGVVMRLLLSSGAPEDPGRVRGTIRYQGSLVSPESGRLSGSLELLGVQLPLKVFRQPLQEVAGKVTFDQKDIDFRGIEGRLLGSSLHFSGRLRYQERPQLTFTLRSPEMDLGQVLSQMNGGADGGYDSLEAKGQVRVDRGKYHGFEFSDLATELAVENRQWRLSNFSARSLGGTVRGSGVFSEEPEGLRFSVQPSIQGIPVKGFLRWFDMGPAELTGKINLAGTLAASGKTGAERKANLDGDFHLEIEDGVVRRFRILVQLLNLLDLSRWFSLKMPDINQEGIRFRKITGDFKVSRGVYSTQNLFVDSDDLRITGAGSVDGPKGQVDFTVAVRPFPGLESAVSFIPLLGQGLAAVKNALLVASFRIQGPVENPVIVPAPLSTLSEFFFGALAIPKKLIFPGEKK